MSFCACTQANDTELAPTRSWRFGFSDGHSVVSGKTKSRYTDIKNRRELCSRFKMMFYVTALKFKTILFLCPSAADSTKQLLTAGSGTSS